MDNRRWKRAGAGLMAGICLTEEERFFEMIWKSLLTVDHSAEMATRNGAGLPGGSATKSIVLMASDGVGFSQVLLNSRMPLCCRRERAFCPVQATVNCLFSSLGWVHQSDTV